jgi:uncharacterized protein YbjQ (UPF0145 family)
MKMLILVPLLVAVLLAQAAHANDRELHFPISEILADPEAKTALGTDIRFFFGSQAAPGAAKDLGEFVTNRKTNAFLKSDKKSCRWAMLSALKTLAERARKLGGNAVVNIRSDYKRNESSSDTDYECHAGATVTGVALKGRIVKLAQ